MGDARTIDPAVVAECGAGMTREMRDRAVAVMKDVLVQLDAKALNVCHNAYVRNLRFGTVVPEFEEEADLRDYLDVVQAECKVCMMGAALLSKARLYDAVPMHKVVQAGGFEGHKQYNVNREDAVEMLADVFTPLQLDMLEAAYEQMAVYTMFRDNPLIWGAVEFGEGFDGDEARVRAIAENVIANDGIFVVDPVADDDEDEDDLDDDE